jgi:imidazolonepropionase-like amidohydrolase
LVSDNENNNIAQQFISMKKFLFFLSLLVPCIAFSQPTFPYNGVLPKKVTSVALMHATIYVDYQTIIDDATLLCENGRVVSVGRDLVIPDNAVRMDLSGKFIYPSFIDLYSDYGMPVSPGKEAPAAVPATEKGAFGWNTAIKADWNAAQYFTCKEDAAKELRAIGFGSVVTHKYDGIVRGTASLVALGNNPNISLISPRIAACYSLNKGASGMSYPSSLMGSIALLRQTYYDMKWYEAGGKLQERNLSLEAMSQLQSLPSIFDAGDKWNVLRADKVGDEFGMKYIIKTSGNEYQRLGEIKAAGVSLIVPLIFPDAFDVSDPLVARFVSLEEMKHWEMAPSNCALLAKEAIPFAITSAGLQDKNNFLKNLRKAVSRGLSEREALMALTWNPATFVQAQKEIGKLQTGYWANFFIASENIFKDGAIIHENWIQGERYIVDAINQLKMTGTYVLLTPLHSYEMKLKEDGAKLKGEILHVKSTAGAATKADSLVYEVNIQRVNELVTISFDAQDEFYKGILRFSGDMNADASSWQGKGQDPSGKWFDWSVRKKEGAGAAQKVDSTVGKPFEVVGEIVFPFKAYGSAQRPKPETVLITNATIWTCDKAGVIENGQVLISGGKIVEVGKSVSSTKFPGIRVIDAQGKHVTPGIIDEHSHIALESVNEGAQASSAEVQEASVVFPEDINIYRQLSGGVTSAQLLHGSANPIGGQSALVKLHWGGNADDMLIDNAFGYIKFALGENVKQSNWQNDGTRFPQTRMGVEQIYYDHFIRAREYGLAKKRAAIKGSSNPPFRVDIEMEALLEILEKKRFVTCHSYVQSEINMLMHVADSLGFTLNTFTHILEGYKVADKMKEHGAGASSFSDWWAYKYEVKDAIPHNGALLWEQGITVAFNSDDAEMARRLNQEAAKAVKYGNVPEEEALKFVTINPAKLLRLDSHTGSLTAGKDADVVIWSAPPLSIYAKAEMTFVDGICYYDIQKDKKMVEQMNAERARLTQKMLNAKSAGASVQTPVMKDKRHFHCDTIDQTSEGILFNR